MRIGQQQVVDNADKFRVGIFLHQSTNEADVCRPELVAVQFRKRCRPVIFPHKSLPDARAVVGAPGDYDYVRIIKSAATRDEVIFIQIRLFRIRNGVFCDARSAIGNVPVKNSVRHQLVYEAVPPCLLDCCKRTCRSRERIIPTVTVRNPAVKG